MSREAPAGLMAMEKLLGLLLAIIGVMVVYYTWQTREIGIFGFSFFLFFGLALTVLGAFMVLVKAE